MVSAAGEDNVMKQERTHTEDSRDLGQLKIRSTSEFQNPNVNIKRLWLTDRKSARIRLCLMSNYVFNTFAINLECCILL